MLIHWIWFATRTGMGDKTKAVLLSHFEDPEEIYFAPELEFERFEELSAGAVESLADKSLLDAEEILESADRELIIPMNPHCESLNAAIAAAIVMWEIRRN